MRASALLLACLLAAALAAPFLAPYPPDRIDLAHRREPPSAAHLFGTDDLGRDVLARVLFGARVSLAVGLLSAAVAGASGIAIGGVAGYAGGALDAVLMRATDAMLAVPRLPLLMIAASVLQPSIPLLVLMIGFAGWMETARLVRAEFRTLRARDFVESACVGRRPRTTDRRSPPAECGAGRDCLADARRCPRDSSGVGLEFLRRRRPAAERQLGQHALPGPGCACDRALARAGAWTVHSRNRALGERRRRSTGGENLSICCRPTVSRVRSTYVHANATSVHGERASSNSQRAGTKPAEHLLLNLHAYPPR